VYKLYFKNIINSFPASVFKKKFPPGPSSFVIIFTKLKVCKIQSCCSVVCGAESPALSVDSPLGCLCVFYHPTVQTVDKPHAIAVHEECRSGTSKTKSLTCSDPLKFKNKVDKSPDSQMYCHCQAHTHSPQQLSYMLIQPPHVYDFLWYL